MVRLTKIYTRGGDQGKTSLTGGKRVDKHDPQVEAYGTVDEVNAHLSLIALHAPETIDITHHLQQDLFDLGADLSTPLPPASVADPALRIQQAQIDYLEQTIDRLNAALSPLTSFVLPGGTAASTYCHIARTVARRAERQTSKLASEQPINPLALIYLNRLSDLLFVMARYFNDQGKRDILWQPGKNR